MSQLRSLPDVQLRDNTYPVDTQSLTILGNEPVPEEIIQKLLQDEWIETQAAPKPDVKVQDEAINADLRRSDVIVIAVETYEERFTGHRHEFVNTEVPMTLTIRTVHSRQRMWNVMAECRRIIYRWILALQPYQSLYFDGFQPDYNGPQNYSGVMRIRLTAGAIPVFRRNISGEEQPSIDPSFFPEGVR